MQIYETREKMSKMRLSGMAKALDQQLEDPEMSSLSFEERVAILIDSEYLDQENKKLSGRLRHAKLKQKAVLEDLDYSGSRGLTKSQISSLSDCNWIARSQNMIITVSII